MGKYILYIKIYLIIYYYTTTKIKIIIKIHFYIVLNIHSCLI